jgi:hypothetical protein
MLTVAALFVVLLIAGRVMDELDWSELGWFILVAIVAVAAVVGLRLPLPFITAALSLLDVVLVIKVFKGVSLR